MIPPLLNINTDLRLKPKLNRKFFRMWPCPCLNPNFWLFLTWIPYSKQIHDANFPAPTHLSVGFLLCHHFCPGHSLLPLLYSFSFSFCQLIPTGLSGLKLSLNSCGRLPCILWLKSGASEGPLVALTALKSHFHFLFTCLYFPVDHELLEGKAWGLPTIYSPVLSKCQVCHNYLLKESMNICSQPQCSCFVENREWHQPTHHIVLTGCNIFDTHLFF